MSFKVNDIELTSIGFNGNEVTSVYYNNHWVWGEKITGDYVKFSAPSIFSVKINTSVNYAPNPKWDGIVEYSTNAYKWDTWDGKYVQAGFDETYQEYVLYLRGTGNKYFSSTWSGSTENCGFYLSASGWNVKVAGDIATLLDYATVRDGGQPEMGEACFQELFYNCRGLVDAKDLILSPTTLTTDCYGHMFNLCAELVAPPALPATTLAERCYSYMFANCDRLTAAPALPAMKMAPYCYESMFFGCEGLLTPPALPAKTLAEGCYYKMFDECDALTSIPALPATGTLPKNCYFHMFYCGFDSNGNVKRFFREDLTSTGYNKNYRVPTSGTVTNATTDAMYYLGISNGYGSLNTNTTYYTNLTVIS